MNDKKRKISFRTDNSTYALLESKAAHCALTVSEYIRRLIKNDLSGQQIEIKSREDFLQRKQLIWEINHIGNNINQIVKNNNAKFYNDIEKKHLFEMMQEIYKLLEKY